MAFGSVHIPAGCTVKLGDTVPGLVDLGVLKGDASIGIAYDKVKVMGSKAETLIDFIKNMKATATFELYQLHLPNIEKLLAGAVTVGYTPGAPLTDQPEVIAAGNWKYDRFYPLAHQMGSGLVPTINRVVGSLDTTLDLTLLNVIAGDTVTINGLVFTAAAATDVTLREFDISAVLDADDAIELALCINDVTYGVPGLTATPVAAVVTLSVDTPLVTGLWASSVGGTITISENDEFVLDVNYFVLKAPDGKWGINIIAGVPITTEDQVVTVDSDYTPAIAYTLTMGEQSVELVAKIVEFSKIIAGKVFRARLWSVTNEAGLTLGFPDSASDEPLSLPVTLVGGLDTAKAAGEQLIEVYDEIGLTFP